jgi:hypothetical protein
VRACVHRGECVRVCVSIFDCTVFCKKKLLQGHVVVDFFFEGNAAVDVASEIGP